MRPEVKENSTMTDDDLKRARERRADAMIEYLGVEPVPDDYESSEAEAKRLREALRLIANGHIAPAELARLALDAPHGIGNAH